MDWLALFTAAGLGSILTSIIQQSLSSKAEHRKLLFSEKREAFVQLLNVYNKTRLDYSTYVNEYLYWLMRASLFSSVYMKPLLESSLYSLKEHPELQGKIMAEMVSAMRKRFRRKRLKPVFGCVTIAR